LNILWLNRWFAAVSLCLVVDFNATPQNTPAFRAARFRLLST
jgi:hypothetical protein